MFKRLLIMTVVLSLMVTPVHANQLDYAVIDTLSQETFSDINEGDWFVDDVSFMMKSGIINGYPDMTFKPQATLTYLDAIVLLIKTTRPYYLEWELENDPPEQGSHWATKHLEVALKHGIIEEKHLELLGKEITRLEFVKMLFASASIREIRNYSEPFSDTNEHSANVLYSENVVKGIEVDGEIYFYPNKTLTRAEATTFARRIYEIQEMYEINN
ncbi:MAG: hypothetical protein CVU98_06465 [Firmicutes bacterium HGW-Firmicutes-3]|jgi:hypothetical protein|nr:MAG: hypothetical protein CVU98_06465 [Firmicutes bacterium HGW-Firmicutes-3]